MDINGAGQVRGGFEHGRPVSLGTQITCIRCQARHSRAEPRRAGDCQSPDWSVYQEPLVIAMHRRTLATTSRLTR